MSETPRARYELNGTRWTVWFEAALIASCWYEEDAERIVQALNHECAATPEHVKALVDIVKMAREYAGKYWLINPRDTRISAAEKVLEELGYE
jgi:hypothetical protein